jgi:putative transposase
MNNAALDFSGPTLPSEDEARVPWELRTAIDDFVSYYNHRRYHESLDNCTPADVYYGRHQQVLSERSKIKKLTMEKRKKAYRDQCAA